MFFFFFCNFAFHSRSVEYQRRKIETFNIEIDWRGASLVFHTRGYSSILFFFLSSRTEYRKRCDLVWSHHLTDVYHPSYRFLSDFKVEKWIEIYKGVMEEGWASNTSSIRILFLLSYDEIWLRIGALLYWYSSMFQRDIPWYSTRRGHAFLQNWFKAFRAKIFLFFFVQYWIWIHFSINYIYIEWWRNF